MAGKIFINYRRDDDPNGAARVRDGLAASFGKANLFMDVDNLLAGQRFDEELAKALAQCDVLIAVIGPRWLDLLNARIASGERDYVREEIAAALQRKIVVIPVRVGREGGLPALPRANELPEDIGELVLHQKHDVAYERFGRDIAELAEAIKAVRRNKQPPRLAPRVPWGWVSATAASVLAIGYAGAYYTGVPVAWPAKGGDPATLTGKPSTGADDGAEIEALRKMREAESAAKQQDAQPTPPAMTTVAPDGSAKPPASAPGAEPGGGAPVPSTAPAPAPKTTPKNAVTPRRPPN